MEEMENIKTKFLALIPAYNESAHLASVLEAVKQQITEILVVDDGSADNTAEIARQAGVHLLSRGYNCGKGHSLKEGYAWALENGYDAVIMLDADGQHDPSCIPAFMDRYQSSHAPLIIGARNYAQIPLRRRVPNVIGKALFSLAVSRSIPDNQSGYRLLNREMMKMMLSSEETGYQFEVEMIALCIAADKPIEWVPIPTIYGDEKSKQKAMDQIIGFPVMCVHARRILKNARSEKRNL